MTTQELSTKELEAKIIEELGKQPVQFEQKDMDMFAMPQLSSLLKTKRDANLLIMAVGASLSGTVGGIVSGVTGGLGLAIAGLPQTLAGAVLKLTVGKTGMLADISDGIILAGISQLVSGVIGTGLGGLAQPFSENVQAQFKQPCECDTTTQERGNVRW